jgi:hypothetical protein
MQKKAYLVPKLETRGGVESLTRGTFGFHQESDPNAPNEP